MNDIIKKLPYNYYAMITWKEPFTIRIGESINETLNDLSLDYTLTESELIIKSSYGLVPEMGNKIRWVVPAKNGLFEWIPAFPDLPIIVSLDEPITVESGMESSFFVSIPIFIQLYFGKYKILDIPTRHLSETWFGLPTEGELGYWHATTAPHKQEKERREFEVLCRIFIRNKSHETLTFSRFRFQSDTIELFLYNKKLWAKDTLITYKGKLEVSHVEQKNSFPSKIENPKKISNARNLHKKGFSLRSFNFLKDLSTHFS